MSVYFIQMGKGGPIKIGVARSVKKRLSAICLPEPLIVLAVIEGSFELEKLIHRALAPFHKRGEWFRPAAEVLAVCSLAKLRGREAIDRWLVEVAEKPYLKKIPAKSGELHDDIQKLTAWAVKETIRIHGLQKLMEVTGRKYDTIADAARGKSAMRVSVFLNLIRLQPDAFAPLFALFNLELIEVGEAIDGYRGKVA